MATIRKQLTNANVYVNGSSYLGFVSEAMMPDISIKQLDHAPLGQHGVTSLPVGFDKMEMTLKFTSFFSEVLTGGMANGYAGLDGQLRSSQESFDGQGSRSAEESFVYFFRGRPINLPTGSFKQHENAEGETKITLDYIKLEIAGATIYEIDVLNNIYEVNGVDLLATYRANLGV